MKKVWITRIRKLCNCAALLACLSLSGCEYFTEENTCINMARENKLWFPDQGFTYFISNMVPDQKPSWRPELGGLSGKLTITNICPVAPIKLNISVVARSYKPENQVLDCLVWVAYKYSDYFSLYTPYYLKSTTSWTKELTIDYVPVLAGIMETGLEIHISLMVTVPSIGNETEEKALKWANDNIEYISIEALFARYR